MGDVRLDTLNGGDGDDRFAVGAFKSSWAGALIAGDRGTDHLYLADYVLVDDPEFINPSPSIIRFNVNGQLDGSPLTISVVATTEYLVFNDAAGNSVYFLTEDIINGRTRRVSFSEVFYRTRGDNSDWYVKGLDTYYTYLDYLAVRVSVSTATVAEDGTSNLVFTFRRAGSTTEALVVNYSIAGTADSTDYTGATPGTGKSITFAAGSATAVLTIDPKSDNTVEADETVAISIVAGKGYTVGSTTAVFGTIANDDFVPPTPPLSPAPSVPKVRDSTGKEVEGVSSERKTSTLSQLTSSVPLKAESSKLLERYRVNDSTSSTPKKASDIDSTFIDFTIKTGGLKSLNAEIALDKEVKANAYVKVNPNTGEAFDFTYDPITGLGAQLLDNNKNGLVDTLKIYLQDGAKGDVDGLVNGEIRDPGVLADAPRQSVYRFFKASKGVHLYTSSDAERANVNANPEWGYKDEGVAYDALVTQGKALHRFFNAKASYHFMTTNDDEAKTVKANPEWGFSYEGESFSVSTIPQLGMRTPVNRFYRVLDGVGQHFYTASADEARNINANPEWGYKSEGVAWYV